MIVYIQDKPAGLIVTLEGRMSFPKNCLERDSALLKRLEAEINARRPPCVFVDFRDLISIDAVYMRALLAYFEEARELTVVKMVGPGKAVRQLCGEENLSFDVPLYPSIAAARNDLVPPVEGDGGRFLERPQRDAPDPEIPGDPEAEKHERAAAAGTSSTGYSRPNTRMLQEELREHFSGELIVDLDQETAYLLAEGDAAWPGLTEQILEFRPR